MVAALRLAIYFLIGFSLLSGCKKELRPDPESNLCLPVKHTQAMYIHEIVYDNQKRPVKIERFLDGHSEVIKYISYDQEGRIMEITPDSSKADESGELWSYPAENIIQIDLLNKLTNVIRFRTVFTFSNGFVSKKEGFDYNGDTFVLATVVKYERDEKGRLLKSSYYNASGYYIGMEYGNYNSRPNPFFSNNLMYFFDEAMFGPNLPGQGTGVDENGKPLNSPMSFSYEDNDRGYPLTMNFSQKIEVEYQCF
jgi:hypothetical protein